MAMQGMGGMGSSTGAGGRAWTVAALMQAVADALQQRIGACLVQGELGGLTRAASGHWYFTLKDETGSASMRCVMFRRAAGLVDFDAREGLRVEVSGRMAVYEPRGDLQFIAEAMRLAGAGALYEEFLRRRARLESQGVFDAARKRPLPAMPTCIGVVTSASGAVFHDIRTALARRAPHVRLILYPSPVQGAAAPAALIQALAVAGARDEIDLLIVARGGGSLEDLWAFNDEALVRAVASFPRPVISGVGHETDITLCDLAADLRAPTPTAAAEMASPASAELLDLLAGRAVHARRLMAARLDREAQRLDRAGLRLSRPGQALRVEVQKLHEAARRLPSAAQRQVQEQQRALALRASRLRAAAQQAPRQLVQAVALRQAKLQALDPTRVLERGYAWVMDAQGRAVTRSQGVAAGDRLSVRLQDGAFDAEVLGPPGAVDPRPPARPRRK